MLAWLWTRLSEDGPETTISGRALKRFPKREVERLLKARVLVEQRKVDTWSVCAHCDCGLDARPVEKLGNLFRACCPHDAVEDLILEEQDLERFSVAPEKLAARIAASGGLTGRTAQIVDGIWAIGTAPSGVVIVLCQDTSLVDAVGTVLSIKAAVDGAPVVLIAADFGAASLVRIHESSLSSALISDVLVSDATGTDRLELGQLADVARALAPGAAAVLAPEARLRIFRTRRTLRLDGRDIVLSLTGFDAFCGAAEKVVAGEVMLTYQELHTLTNRASHRDVINEIRDQFQKHGLSREQAFGLVKIIHGRGMTIGLSAHDIDVCD